MTTIYNENDLRLEIDDEAVSIHNFGIQLLEMTREEYLSTAIKVLSEMGYEVVKS